MRKPKVPARPGNRDSLNASRPSAAKVPSAYTFSGKTKKSAKQTLFLGRVVDLSCERDVVHEHTPVAEAMCDGKTICVRCFVFDKFGLNELERFSDFINKGGSVTALLARAVWCPIGPTMSCPVHGEHGPLTLRTHVIRSKKSTPNQGRHRCRIATFTR